MKIEAIRPEFNDIITPSAEIETIAEGFAFTEGPLWHSAERMLLFSDIPSNRIYVWREGEAVRPFRDPSHFSNGLTFDRDGRLIACEHQSRAITSQNLESGEVTTLADDYQGRRLNSPNDVICASDGSIIFTDPIYGLRRGMGGPAEQELNFEGLFRIPPSGGALQLLSDHFERPNGLALSPAGEILYVADTVRQHIRAFRVTSDWQLNGGQIWAELWDDNLTGRPDGMKVDEDGRVFSTGPGGVWIFDKQANLLGRIYLPEKTSNLAWGEDGRSLFITCSSAVFRVRCLTRGRAPLDD